MASDDKPRRRKRPPRPHPSEVFAELYDPWAIPMSDEEGAPEVMCLHDGLDWVQVHAPRAFFQELLEQIERGETDDLVKWATVWATPRKEYDPSLCGSPTNRGIPCHFTRPCPYHPQYRRPA